MTVHVYNLEKLLSESTNTTSISRLYSIDQSILLFNNLELFVEQEHV